VRPRFLHTAISVVQHPSACLSVRGVVGTADNSTKEQQFSSCLKSLNKTRPNPRGPRKREVTCEMSLWPSGGVGVGVQVGFITSETYICARRYLRDVTLAGAAAAGLTLPASPDAPGGPQALAAPPGSTPPPPLAQQAADAAAAPKVGRTSPCALLHAFRSASPPLFSVQLLPAPQANNAFSNILRSPAHIETKKLKRIN